MHVMSNGKCIIQILESLGEQIDIEQHFYFYL